jgi:hypothetical protein
MLADKLIFAVSIVAATAIYAGDVMQDQEKTLIALARAAQGPLMTKDDLTLIAGKCGVTDLELIYKTPTFGRPQMMQGKKS